MTGGWGVSVFAVVVGVEKRSLLREEGAREKRKTRKAQIRTPATVDAKTQRLPFPDITLPLPERHYINTSE